MKKISLFLLALVCSVGIALANTESFDYADYKTQGTTSTGSAYTMDDKTYVSIGDDKFFGNNSQAHFYAGGTITVTPKNGATITKVAITTTSTSYNGYQSNGKYTASTGSVAKNSSNSAIVEWTGSATSAFTLGHDKQIRWTSIEVTYSLGGSGDGDDDDDPTPTPAAQPTTVNFSNLGYTTWGKNASFSGTDFDEVSQTKNGVTFTYTRNSGSCYANSSAIRFYKSNELTFAAPTGYKIISVEFTGSAYLADVTTDQETCTSTTKALSWEGEAASVTFTRPSNASGYITLSAVVVSLAPVVTIGAAGYSTYCAPFNFTATGVTVYKAALNNDGTAINLTAVEGIIPANEGVILGGSGNVTIVPTTETASADVDDNELIGTTAAISTPANAYVLKANEAEFAHFTGATIPANKAYLVISASAPLRMEVVPSNPVATGVENVATVKATKALVNGKLVIVKNGQMFNVNGMLVK